MFKNGYVSDSRKVKLFTMHEHTRTEQLIYELQHFSIRLLADWRSATMLRNAWIISMNMHYSSCDQVPVYILYIGVQT
jgi:hypothetical protein